MYIIWNVITSVVLTIYYHLGLKIFCSIGVIWPNKQIRVESIFIVKKMPNYLELGVALSSLIQSDTLPKVTADCHFRTKVIGKIHISCIRSILLYCMLTKHSKCTYTTFKLIQMRAEDNQVWWQIPCCLQDGIRWSWG